MRGAKARTAPQSDGVSPTDVSGGVRLGDCAAIDAQANPNDALNAGVGVDGILTRAVMASGQGGTPHPAATKEPSELVVAGLREAAAAELTAGPDGPGAAAAVPVEALWIMQTNQTTVWSPSGAGVGGTVEGNGASGSGHDHRTESPAITAGDRRQQAGHGHVDGTGESAEGIGATTYKLYKNGVEVPGV